MDGCRGEGTMRVEVVVERRLEGFAMRDWWRPVAGGNGGNIDL